MLEAYDDGGADVLSRLDIFVKDMGIVTGAARRLKLATPVAAAAEQLYLVGRPRVSPHPTIPPSSASSPPSAARPDLIRSSPVATPITALHPRGARRTSKETSCPLALLAIGVGGIGLLLLLIVKLKVNAFLALLITSVLVGLAAGVPLATIPATEDAPERLGIIPAIIAGMGGTLGSVAILVALGSMLGRIIELSGGASSLAGRFTKPRSPPRRGALTAAALVLAIPSSSTSASSSSCRSSTASARRPASTPSSSVCPSPASCSPSTSPCRLIRESSEERRSWAPMWER